MGDVVPLDDLIESAVADGLGELPVNGRVGEQTEPPVSLALKVELQRVGRQDADGKGNPENS